MLEKKMTTDPNLYMKDFIMNMNYYSEYKYREELYSEMMGLVDI